ncbi:hypothetical protein [Mycobacterium avium]|uniref:hypothetical protein n=1 Tax=Mycobacterium avium TaxID=1764 RepID=UPI0007A09B75|nr:hypothetical protein [Mycobacterium avium]
MTRFTVTDTMEHRRAVARLDAAGRSLALSIRGSTQDLDQLDGDPQRAAELLARWRRRQAQIARHENELMLVLFECGASERALATLMHIGRPAVTARLAAARDERESAA